VPAAVLVRASSLARSADRGDRTRGIGIGLATLLVVDAGTAVLPTLIAMPSSPDVQRHPVRLCARASQVATAIVSPGSCRARVACSARPARGSTVLLALARSRPAIAMLVAIELPMPREMRRRKRTLVVARGERAAQVYVLLIRRYLCCDRVPPRLPTRSYPRPSARRAWRISRASGARSPEPEG